MEEYVCNNLDDFGNVCAESEDGLQGRNREKISAIGISELLPPTKIDE